MTFYNLIEKTYISGDIKYTIRELLATLPDTIVLSIICEDRNYDLLVDENHLTFSLFNNKITPVKFIVQNKKISYLKLMTLLCPPTLDYLIKKSKYVSLTENVFMAISAQSRKKINRLCITTGQSLGLYDLRNIFIYTSDHFLDQLPSSCNMLKITFYSTTKLYKYLETKPNLYSLYMNNISRESVNIPNELLLLNLSTFNTYNTNYDVNYFIANSTRIKKLYSDDDLIISPEVAEENTTLMICKGVDKNILKRNVDLPRFKRAKVAIH